MRINNDQDKLILSYQRIATKEINANEYIENIIENRRRIYAFNCPRKYIHLVDIAEYYLVDSYNIEADKDFEAMKLLLLNKDRIVLIDPTNIDISKLNNKYMATIKMENSDKKDLYLLYPISDNPDMSYHYATTYASRILAFNMDKGDIVVRNPEFEKLPYVNIRCLYDENTIAQLVFEEYILLTDATPINISGEEKLVEGVFIRHHDTLYVVNISKTKAGNKVLDFPTMTEVTEDIYMLGDYVLFNSNEYVIYNIKYGKALLDPMSHVYEIMNVKTGTTHSVLYEELEPIGRTLEMVK
nr:MAG TPA: hypothetical protein [Caudoviricetes sp.]